MLLIDTVKDRMISDMLIFLPVNRVEVSFEKLLITFGECLAIPRIRSNKCSVNVKYDKSFGQGEVDSCLAPFLSNP